MNSDAMETSENAQTHKTVPKKKKMKPKKWKPNYKSNDHFDTEQKDIKLKLSKKCNAH